MVDTTSKSRQRFENIQHRRKYGNTVSTNTLDDLINTTHKDKISRKLFNKRVKYEIHCMLRKCRKRINSLEKFFTLDQIMDFEENYRVVFIPNGISLEKIPEKYS